MASPQKAASIAHGSPAYPGSTHPDHRHNSLLCMGWKIVDSQGRSDQIDGSCGVDKRQFSLCHTPEPAYILSPRRSGDSKRLS